ncbi:OB-fold domain-containing protein [Erythrobacter sp. SCSIO 43205]|uniref:Zn-ribbon domain-containing OB-fold protein n=1 Tax=Erythrobacter sp. SCSIO 43205 TaxID=2779361 RepID=UPI001CA9FD39|nr:OB-fold domain-containing protein [Erythrobacter sp. SCSIO 43205]UAB79341.1 OB-fold domain-containing protein [Erythrobacter sp. SCSIO 43205]
MRPIADNLFTSDDPPRLIGGRERETGRVVFPLPDNDRYEAYPLSREGTLWSYTIQRFRPKSPPYAGPEAFEPWALGYVELPGETIVEARIANVDFDDIEIGMPLQLTVAALDRPDADTVAIPAFEPVESAA